MSNFFKVNSLVGSINVLNAMEGNMTRFLVLVLVVLGSIFTACSSDGTSCPTGEKAVSGECYTMCGTQRDCFDHHGGGWVCVAGGYCQLSEQNGENNNYSEENDVVVEDDIYVPPTCVPSPEICDGLDNDCDKQIDEGVKNRCGECGVEPTEVCDGEDNDCDGVIDEDCICIPGEVEQCGVDKGVCHFGSKTCDANYKWSECENAIMPSKEMCNYLDDDCDGESDEDFDLSDDPMNCGICGNKCAVTNAINSCVNSECVFECLPNFYDFDNVVGCETPCVLTNAGVEQCDGIDNDCDGAVDEDFNFNSLAHCGGCNKVCDFKNAGEVCLSGNCLMTECEVGFVDLNKDEADGCEFGCSYSGDEICDELDNDCDGSVDELIYCECEENAEMDCGPDVGICHDGHQYCHDGKWSVCDGTFGFVEICNYLDDDCDGQTDEDFNLLTDEENCGYCSYECEVANASAVCVNGKCQMNNCNFGWVDADNDIDNGCEYDCLPTNGGVEQCDNIDNDCDGQLDEDFDLAIDFNNCGSCGHDCTLPGVEYSFCSTGKCQIVTCNENYFELNGVLLDGCEYYCEISNEGMEICDGLDNDCDGTADNNGAECDCELGDSQACGSSEGECEKGTQLCLANGDYGLCDDFKPTVEICDGKDNNCDGSTDETFNLMTDVNHCGECGNLCNSPNAINGCVGGNCIIVSCFSGWWNLEGLGCNYGCFPTNNGVEKCDDIDNDCDGQLDEDFDFQNDSFNCGVCGNVCNFYGTASNLCVAGKCQIVTCQSGYYDLDNAVSDGCEYKCDLSNGGIEIGDNKDNDCDGDMDEGVTCLEYFGIQCGQDEGECAFGFQYCENGFMTVCDDRKPSAEMCDYKDNDCDGLVDEDFNLLIDRFNCGECGFECNLPNAVSNCVMGQCAVVACFSGYYNLDGKQDTGCEYGCFKTHNGIEQCDGIDNDCNALEDEIFDLQTDPTNCGACDIMCGFNNGIDQCINGVCVMTGCNPGYWDLNGATFDGCEYQCQSANGGIEQCDGIDSDCDGVLYEGCFCESGDLQICGFNNVGECHYGFQICVLGDWTNCQNEKGPVIESCNGLDDDCDGKADESVDIMTDVENCGGCGNFCMEFKNAHRVCNQGVCIISHCDPSFYDLDNDFENGCEYQCMITHNGLEQCDGIDNDCDNQIDETYDFSTDIMNCGGCAIRCEFPGAIGFCSSGVCQTNSCLANYFNLDGDWSNGCEYHCVISNGGVEIGDNKDNDCDGGTDEGAVCVEGSSGVCGTMTGECELGTHVCSGNKWTNCIGEKVGTVEVCDGLDNDCDGSADEDFNLLTDENNCGTCGNVCNFANAESICLNGVCQISQCLPSFWSFSDTPGFGCWYQCVPTNNGVEVCDGIDNNCDRVIDGGPNIDKMTDVHNCGACGNDCTDLAQVNTASCINGVCFINSCIYGYNNFDGFSSTGCEAFCVPTGPEVFNGIDDDCDNMTDEGTSPSDMISCSLCCGVGAQPIIWYGAPPVIWTTSAGMNCGTVTMAQSEICQRGKHPSELSSGWVDFNCFDGTNWGGWSANAVASCTNDTKGTAVSWEVITGIVDPRGEAEIILKNVGCL